MDGTIIKTREADEPGAHTMDDDINHSSIAICLAGDFTKHNPTKRQFDAFKLLLLSVQREYGIPESRIVGHREVGSTACPGQDFTPKNWRNITPEI